MPTRKYASGSEIREYAERYILLQTARKSPRGWCWGATRADASTEASPLSTVCMRGPSSSLSFAQHTGKNRPRSGKSSSLRKRKANLRWGSLSASTMSCSLPEYAQTRLATSSH